MKRSTRSRLTEQLTGGILLIVLTFTVAAIVLWMLNLASEREPYEYDPSGGTLPHCTHEIADAGGMCWGEPR